MPRFREKIIASIGASALGLGIVLFASPVHAAEVTPQLTGGAIGSANHASNYSDNGAGFAIDTASAPWTYGPFTSTIGKVSLALDTSAAGCTASTYVQISRDGTTWLTSDTQTTTLLDGTFTAVNYTIVGPLQREDFARVRLRRVGGSCTTGSIYFAVRGSDDDDWNMVPPTGTDVNDAYFALYGSEAELWGGTIGSGFGGGGGGSWDEDTTNQPSCAIFGDPQFGFSGASWDFADGDGFECLWTWTKYLIVPTSDAWNAIGTVRTSIATGFPIGYLTSAYEQVSDAFATSVGSCPSSWSAVGPGGGTYGSWTLPVCDIIDDVTTSLSDTFTQNALAAVLALGTIFALARKSEEVASP